LLEPAERASGIHPAPALLRRDSYRPGRPRGYLLWLVATALVVAIGLALRNHDALMNRLWPSGPAGVPMAQVRSGAVEQTIRLAGTTVGQNSVLLRTPLLKGQALDRIR
jgi:hypothetical protein